MPSTYSLSARYVLQATGENNNTWGVILNQGVFQLIDDNINGHLALTLSGSHVLTTANGATDEARMAFLDVYSGSGGAITIPPVPKGYFVRNATAGDVSVSAGGPVSAVFASGDSGPVFADGLGSVYPIFLGYKPLRQFITDADQTVINYVNAVISAGNQLLPPAAGQSGHALMVRGAPGSEVWVPDAVQQADVAGLSVALATLTANDVALAPAVGLNAVLSRAFYGDMF